MIFEFRTASKKDGSFRYLGIDTGSETYSTTPRKWTSRDLCKLSVKDYKELIDQCERWEYKKV